MKTLDIYLTIALLQATTGDTVRTHVLTRETGLAPTSLNYHLRELLKSGDIKKVKRGHYVIQLNDFTEAIYKITSLS